MLDKLLVNEKSLNVMTTVLKNLFLRTIVLDKCMI